jgi:hypothetical protein
MSKTIGFLNKNVKKCVIKSLKKCHKNHNMTPKNQVGDLLSITAQTIFAIKSSACWKGILIENNTKIKNKKNNNDNFYFWLGSLKMELPKMLIFNIFQIQLLLLSRSH